MFKVFAWVAANFASIFGIVQAVLKAVKEIITAVVNLISVFMTKEQAEAAVLTLRTWVNRIDNWIEIIKEKLL